jgi:hypothetical protein
MRWRFASSSEAKTWASQSAPTLTPVVKESDYGSYQ